MKTDMLTLECFDHCKYWIYDESNEYTVPVSQDYPIFSNMTFIWSEYNLACGDVLSGYISSYCGDDFHVIDFFTSSNTNFGFSKVLGVEWTYKHQKIPYSIEQIFPVKVKSFHFQDNLDNRDGMKYSWFEGIIDLSWFADK
jgi:hypothetical protein